MHTLMFYLVFLFSSLILSFSLSAKSCLRYDTYCISMLLESCSQFYLPFYLVLNVWPTHISFSRSLLCPSKLCQLMPKGLIAPTKGLYYGKKPYGPNVTFYVSKKPTFWNQSLHDVPTINPLTFS